MTALKEQFRERINQCHADLHYLSGRLDCLDRTLVLSQYAIRFKLNQVNQRRKVLIGLFKETFLPSEN